MKRFIFILIIIGFSLSLLGQEKLTMQDAIQKALANNYSILMVKKQKEIARKNVTPGNAGILPRFNVNGGVNYAINNSYIELTQVEQPIIADNAATTNYNAAATLNWTIFDGLGMFVNYNKLEAQKEKSDIELQVSVENTIRNLVGVYYSAVRNRENIELLKANLDLTLDRLSRVKDRVEYGAANSIQLLNAQVDRNTDSTSLLQSELQFNNDKRMINFVLGNEYQENYTLEDDVTFREMGDLDELIDRAKKLNSSINRAMKEKEISEYDKKLIVSTMYPRINLSGGYSFNRQEAEEGFFLINETEGLNAGVNFQWDIYNLTQAQNNKENAELMVEMMNISIRQIESQIEMNVRNAYDNYSRQKLILEMEEANLSIAEENYNRSKDLYNLGQITSVELRQAQINLLGNQQRINNSKYLLKTAETELLLLTGQIMNGE